MYYAYGSIWAMPTYGVYRLYDNKGFILCLKTLFILHQTPSSYTFPSFHQAKERDLLSYMYNVQCMCVVKAQKLNCTLYMYVYSQPFRTCQYLCSNQLVMLMVRRKNIILSSQRSLFKLVIHVLVHIIYNACTRTCTCTCILLL